MLLHDVPNSAKLELNEELQSGRSDVREKGLEYNMSPRSLCHRNTTYLRGFIVVASFFMHSEICVMAELPDDA